MPTRLIKRSFTLNRHRTSVALEPEFWSALQAIADARKVTLLQLVAAADEARVLGDSLASGLRLIALAPARK